MTLEKEAARFLAWMKEHGDRPAKLEDGVLTSAGCRGDFGCCANCYNLSGLADELEKLVAPAPAPKGPK